MSTTNLFTQVDLIREQVVCREIFIIYTDYALNAARNKLFTEKKYTSESMHLHSLIYLMNRYRYAGGKFYLGAIEVDPAEIERVVDYIHHYSSVNVATAIYRANNSPVVTPPPGTGGSGSTGTCSEFVYEFPAQPTNRHYLDLKAGSVIVQVFLNGDLISSNDWVYANKIFTYTGRVTLRADDWFFIYGKTGCGVDITVNPCQFGNYQVTVESYGCRFGTYEITRL